MIAIIYIANGSHKLQNAMSIGYSRETNPAHYAVDGYNRFSDDDQSKDGLATRAQDTGNGTCVIEILTFT